MYVRLRAISSRVNRNNDGWPSIELAGSKDIFDRHKESSSGFTVEAADGDPQYGFRSFIGKPNFIDHNNSDPSRARGVVVDAKLRVLPIERVAASGDDYWTGSSLDPEHAPPTEIELLLEIDAKQFPKYAKAVRSGDLDGFSMGCDVERSKCSHCGHVATNPDEYCSHILMKGAHHDYKTADGKRISRKSYENCYGIHFFEISGVFDPADETALAREVRAAINAEGNFQKGSPEPGDDAYFGGKPGASKEAYENMKKEYGDEKGEEVYYATRNKHKGTKKSHTYEDGPEGHYVRLDNGERLGPYDSQAEAKEAGDKAVEEDNTRESSMRIAENPLPQSFETTAPEEVDTMRQEHNCPICGETMDGETCDVCFLPGTLIRTKAGYLPIEDIVPGDEVLGESGKFNQVMDTVVREWHGHVKKIDGPSLVEPIYTTNNHPFKVLVGDHKAKTERCQPARCERHSEYEDIHHLDWAHAGCLSSDSYVATNIPLDGDEIGFIEIPRQYTDKHKNGQVRKGPRQLELTDDMLWAIGLYIAEGSAGDRSITYSSHKNEVEYQRRIQFLFELLGYHTRLIHRDDKPNSTWMEISSSVLSEWLPDWLGTGCENKHIPVELMNLPLDRLRHVYQGILDGDGCDRGNDLKQTSKVLALQVNEIARRLGVSATIQRAHEPGKKESFTVNNVLDKKRGYNVSVSGKTTKAPRNTWDIEGQKLYRLKSVEDVDYYGPVYNLKVANDPTYTVQNLAVHNCGYVEPPKGMDNPDLTKAKELQGDDQQAAQKNVQEDDSMVQHQEEPQGQPMPPAGGPQSHPKQPGSFLQTRNTSASNSVMGDMRWQPKLNPRVAARIKQFEKPLLPGTTPASNDPQEVVVTKSPQKPVTAAMRTAQDLIEAAKHNQTGDTMSTTHTADGPTGPEASPDARVDVTGTGGVMDASNEAASTADAQTDVLGVGSTGVTDVGAEKTESLPTAGQESDDSGFDATKTTDDSGPTKTFGDSDGTERAFTDSVTNESLEGNQNKDSSVRQAYDAKPFYDQPGLSGGSANQGTQPADPVGKAQDRVDVLSPTATPDNNSGPTSQWTGTEGNKVERQQDPVTTEISDMQFDGFTSHFVAGLKLADMEVDLGLIERDAKYERLAELSAQTDEEITAQADMLSRVKTAGTKKLAQARTAGVTRMPGAFGRTTAAAKRFAGDDESVDAPVDEDVADAALFSR